MLFVYDMLTALFSALGIIALLYIGYGMLILRPAAKRMAARLLVRIENGKPPEEAVQTAFWLSSMLFARCGIILIDEGLSAQQREIIDRLEQDGMDVSICPPDRAAEILLRQ